MGKYLDVLDQQPRSITALPLAQQSNLGYDGRRMHATLERFKHNEFKLAAEIMRLEDEIERLTQEEKGQQ